jgi:hypothetical protein
MEVHKEERYPRQGYYKAPCIERRFQRIDIEIMDSCCIIGRGRLGEGEGGVEEDGKEGDREFQRELANGGYD